MLGYFFICCLKLLQYVITVDADLSFQRKTAIMLNVREEINFADRIVTHQQNRY